MGDPEENNSTFATRGKNQLGMPNLENLLSDCEEKEPRGLGATMPFAKCTTRNVEITLICATRNIIGNLSNNSRAESHKGGVPVPSLEATYIMSLDS